ncbi:hypothetical protein IAU59_006997 [Kwoniella sp. CBS 9459]
MPALRTKKSKTSRARIKRIMQLDEEVGKLASATPVMISKSLECFMQMLIDETCKETRSRGSKKMTAYHLKAMINTNETFDFLREIVESIPDPVIAEPKASASGAGPSKTRKASNPAVPSSSNNPNESGAAPKRRTKKQVGTEYDQQPDFNAGGYGAVPPAGVPGYGQAPYHPGTGAGGGAFDGGRYGGSSASAAYGQGQVGGYGHPHPPSGPADLPAPSKLPSIGTWKSDFTGGGGTGEGGRGIFDDYEEDDDDY